MTPAAIACDSMNPGGLRESEKRMTFWRFHPDPLIDHHLIKAHDLRSAYHRALRARLRTCALRLLGFGTTTNSKTATDTNAVEAATSIGLTSSASSRRA
jgi:hypothetical protein